MRRQGPALVINRQYQAEGADIVIVGNGIAGLTAAVETRRLAPGASIVIISEQSYPTINTPALKQFAIGKLTQKQLLAYPAGTERTQDIHVINARVEEINAQSKYVRLSGGYGFGYGSLLIATGSAPAGFPDSMPGGKFDGVLTLHRLQDYLDLRRRLYKLNGATVVGGGAHAIETVMALLYLGISVHWLIRGTTILSQRLDHPASEMVLDSIRRAGAKVYTDTQVVGIVGRVGSVIGVVTDHHQMLLCDLVLACNGTTPVTTLAERCNIPMAHKNGILVDDQLRTNVGDIYAAGDVAALKNPQTQDYERRPQWYAAVLQGRTVAAAMTGHYELASQAFGVPWHATQLGELYMLTVGNPLSWTEDVMTLTDSSKRSYRRMTIIGDRLVGYLSLGLTQPDSLAIKRIIDEGLSIRDVKEALLKGDFDARKYFSQQQSRVVLDMVTSGKLPVVGWAQSSSSPVRSLSTTHPALKACVSRNTYALPYQQVSNVGARQTEPLNEPIPALTTVDNQPPLHGTEEVGPLTGNLPGFPEKVSGPLAVLHPSCRSARSFWSYSDTVPAVETERSSSGSL